ncbi:MAG: EAL domain-containing protein [Lachnospiraceae bacterium]|nr:EAL domain-containing protein [Lachnospiraceae bacterium]
MNYIIHYDIAAIIVTVVIGIHFYMKKNISTVQNRIFKALLAVELLASVFDLMTVFTIKNPMSLTRPLHYVLNVVYLAMFNLTPVVYFTYILKVIKKTASSSRKEKLLIVVPISICELLIVTSPIHGLIFRIGQNGEYIHGILFWFLYAVSLYYVAMSQYYTIRFRKFFSSGQIVSVSCYTVFCFVIIIMQAFFPNLLMTQFAVSIAVLLIYFSLENPLNYEEKDLGTYNKTAFEKVALELIGSETPFQVLGIEIEGMKYITDALGVENANRLLKQFSELILTIADKEKVFFMGGYRFVILSEKNGNWDEIIAEIQERFSVPFLTDTVSVTMSAPMCVVAYPKNAKRLADIMTLLDIGIVEANQISGTPVIYANDELLKKGRREAEIVQIMKYALHEHKFEVYYQPIYSVEKKCYVSAEALIRLRHEEFGFISPEEFIPIAERNGLILEIGEFVFCEVCRFISEAHLLERGIEYIDVNLSVVQCMQSTLYLQLLDIMNRYKLPYNCINLEITETAAVMSQETLIENMDKLREYGINFSLDDYGTGFANTAAVVKYPFHTVKLDKSMVWSAMDDKKAMSALKYSIAMLKEMGMELIAEGVEEPQQAQLLEEMGCDFFQGYYYSRPVCGAEFLEKLAEMEKRSSMEKINIMEVQET